MKKINWRSLSILVICIIASIEWIIGIDRLDVIIQISLFIILYIIIWF
jgi:hypothetical protein